MPLFEIEGRTLLMNEGTARIVYTRDVTQQIDDPGAAHIADLDPLCARAIVTALASKLAWPFQQSRTLRESLLSEYDGVIARARNANSRTPLKTLSNPAGKVPGCTPDPDEIFSVRCLGCGLHGVACPSGAGVQPRHARL